MIELYFSTTFIQIYNISIYFYAFLFPIKIPFYKINLIIIFDNTVL